MQKMLFCNIGWMNKYQGLGAGDKIKGGGSFVSKHGFGWEIYNFKPFKGKMYGYVQPKGKINIHRLGASKGSDKVENALVIWTARRLSGGGVVILGWYKDATVYRNHQPAPEGSDRKNPDKTESGFFIEAEEKKHRLLPIDARIFKIPRGKNGMGQSNVWYADQKQHLIFKQKVLDFITNIEKGKIFKKPMPPKAKNGKAWQPDPYKRQKIEKIAIEKTKKYFENLGYIVDSFEKDNIGWDLEAIQGDQRLKLEVKGLSGKDLLIEFTPKEYEKMKEYVNSYRICVVTDVLKRPFLRIFSFSPENERWEDDRGPYLKITEIVSARMSL